MRILGIPSGKEFEVGRQVIILNIVQGTEVTLVPQFAHNSLQKRNITLRVLVTKVHIQHKRPSRTFVHMWVHISLKPPSMTNE